MYVRLILLALIWAAGASAWPASLQITLTGSAFQGSNIDLNYNFAALSGDVIEVPDGKHRVSFDSRNGYSFTVDIVAGGNSITLGSSSHRAPNCEQPKQVTWPPPSLRPSAQSPGTFLLSISEPTFGASSGATSCILPSMMACNSRKVVLKATSVPTSAEIWIDGKRAIVKTDTTLSVPFCTYDTSKYVVLRSAGYVNCTKSIALSPNAEITAHCAMKALAQTAK